MARQCHRFSAPGWHNDAARRILRPLFYLSQALRVERLRQRGLRLARPEKVRPVGLAEQTKNSSGLSFANTSFTRPPLRIAGRPPASASAALRPADPSLLQSSRAFRRSAARRSLQAWPASIDFNAQHLFGTASFLFYR